MRVWRGLGLVVVILLILGAGAWLFRGQIAVAIMTRAYDKAMGADLIASLPDGLHVGLCGSGSPMPDPTRAGPCTVVVAGRQLFAIDSGPGSTKNLSLMGLPPARVNAIFLTHFHSDHIGDLGELMLQRWASGAATTPVPVYGPTGVDQVVTGFEQAYSLDSGYRVAHHGPKVVPPSGFGGAPHPFTMIENGPGLTLIDQPDLKVIAFGVDHGPVHPAVGYLFIYKGRRVLISGDTSPSPRVEAMATGVDVLVHEGLAPNLVAIQRQAALNHGRANLAAIFHDILTYHTTPEQAAAIARDARALPALHPRDPAPAAGRLGRAVSRRSAEIYKGPIRVGHDGDFLTSGRKHRGPPHQSASPIHLRTVAVNSLEPIALSGAPGSPYTRKMLAVLRYRRIPYRLLPPEGPALADLPKPKVRLLPTFYLPGPDGALEAVVDSTPIIRRLEKERSGRSVIPADPALAFPG